MCKWLMIKGFVFNVYFLVAQVTDNQLLAILSNSQIIFIK